LVRARVLCTQERPALKAVRRKIWDVFNATVAS
jgi:hypothetical protein